MDLGRMLEDVAGRFGDRTAFLYEEDSISYERLNRSVNAFANYLRTLGLHRGDHIAVMLVNCPEFVISYFAIQKIGGVAVTLNVLVQFAWHKILRLYGADGATTVVRQA